MGEPNFSSFEEISSTAKQEEGDAVVENRRRSSPVAEAEVGRRSPLLSQGGNAAEPGRSVSERPPPDHGSMGLVLMAETRQLAVVARQERGSFAARLGHGLVHLEIISREFTADPPSVSPARIERVCR